MSQLVRIGRFNRGKPVTTGFERWELTRLLSLYSSRVAVGEWRDYAIDMTPGRAIFAVFRASFERPLFTISKLAGGEFEVASGRRRLTLAATLEEALTVFDRTLRLVTH
jgi:hypothetical protein